MSTLHPWILAALLFVAAPGLVSCASDSGGAKQGTIDSPTANVNGGVGQTSQPTSVGDLVLSGTFEEVTEEGVLQRPPVGSQAYSLALLWGHGADAGQVGQNLITTTRPRAWELELAVSHGSVSLVRMLAPPEARYTVLREAPGRLLLTGRTAADVIGAMVTVNIDPGASRLLSIGHEGAGAWVLLDNLDWKGGGSLGAADGVDFVHWAGYSVRRGCERGFSFGGWENIGTNSWGTVTGQVLDGSGARIGWVKGLFGHSPAVDSVPVRGAFYGEYSNLRGSVTGLASGDYSEGVLSGTWSAGHPNPPARPSAISRAVDDGTVKGVYGDALPGGRGGQQHGVWLAAWAAACPLRGEPPTLPPLE